MNNLSSSLGFTLDEAEVAQKACYLVQCVESGSASAQAGLRPGDKITRINGKSTVGMSLVEFCHEIQMAQQQQLKNNMIHLMVMRKSVKNTANETAQAVSAESTEPGKHKASSVLTVDEGYVPGSLTSSATHNAIPTTLLNPLVKVTPGKLTHSAVFSRLVH